MGVEATHHHRVRCMECKYREDHETAILADSDAMDHNDVFHNGKKVAERGTYHPRENYWGFPA